MTLSPTSHEAWMARALALASRGVGFTSPNPMVGAVIVRDGRIIGEGWHRQAGGPHAEVAALRSAKEPVAGATMYVTLEPCCHFGKTPPCSQAVIDAEIARVYYAARDINPRVSGGGHAQMVAAGIEVHQGLLEKEANALNRAFFHYIQHKTPFVFAKFAMSLDGKIATHSGDSKWITQANARQVGMALRHYCDGILVGSGTIEKDQPSLTTRCENAPALNSALYPLKHLWERFPEAWHPSPFHLHDEPFIKPSLSPTRIILDSHKGLSPQERVFDPQLGGNPLLFTTQAKSGKVAEAFENQGVTCIQVIPDQNGRIPLTTVLDECGKRNMVSIMVEGGNAVHGSFFQQHLVQEIWAFIAPKIIGGQNAPSPIGGLGSATMADAKNLEWISQEYIEGDLLLRAKVLNPT